jgi:hypothetical protein
MSNGNTLTVTEKDAAVELTVGDLLIVRLGGPLGETHGWRIVGGASDCLRVLERAPLDRLGKAPPSRVELQVLYLRAEAAGDVELLLEYRGISSAEVEKQHRVAVCIRPAASTSPLTSGERDRG